MALIMFGKEPEKVTPPEEDIQEVITSANNFLEKNPNREDVGIGVFGHHCYMIRRGHVEGDVREAAKTATTYSKA